MGAIMDTIEPLMGTADQAVGEILGGATFDDLKSEVRACAGSVSTRLPTPLATRLSHPLATRLSPLATPRAHLLSPPILTASSQVSKMSAKLFCMAEDLKGRVPLGKAIDLLKLYHAIIRGCGGGFNEARGLCGAQLQLDQANPGMSRKQARAAGKACVAAARVEKKACAARLLPKFQTLREDIVSDMRSLNSDARAVWR